jgi:hypothetical protein
MDKWTRHEAIEFCFWMEKVAPTYGCHIALTGGLLYKEDEPRKDLDIIVYRIRQVKQLDYEGLMAALKRFMPITDVLQYSAWLTKAKYNGKKIDFLFPDQLDGDYIEDGFADEY